MRTRGECARPRLSQDADCLPVSLFMLHSSSQAQVCVGSGVALSDDSNSRRVPAPSRANTHRRREHTTVHLHTQSRTSHTSHIPDRIQIYGFPAYQNDHHIRHTQAWYVNTYKASCCLQWSLALGQAKQAVEISWGLTVLSHGPRLDLLNTQLL